MSVKDFDQFFLSEHLDISIQFSRPVMNATVSSLFKILQKSFFFFSCWKLLFYTVYSTIFSSVSLQAIQVGYVQEQSFQSVL